MSKLASNFIRAFALEDISIRSGGDGRTVEAYFNSYTGEYLGPDDDGVEPCWNDASL